MNRLSRQITTVASALTLALVGACGDGETAEGDQPSDGAAGESAFVDKNIGFRTIDCEPPEDDKLFAAWTILAALRTTTHAQFANCVNSAELIEAGCNDQIDRTRIIETVAQHEYVEFTCKDLNVDKKPMEHTTLALGAVDIPELRMWVDPKLIAMTPTFIAGVMAHEMMHNIGFRHVENPIDTAGYKLTVPQQVRACVRRGTPNAAPAGHVSQLNICLNAPPPPPPVPQCPDGAGGWSDCTPPPSTPGQCPDGAGGWGECQIPINQQSDCPPGGFC